MSAIKATWNGNGLPDGTTLASGNVNTPGNSFGTGASWAFAGTTPAEDRLAVTAGNGVRITAASSGMVMIRALFAQSPTSLRGQVIATIPDEIDGTNVGIIQANQDETNRGWIRLTSQRTFEIYHSQDIPASRSPALAVGSKALVDVVYHAGPSAARMFYRVTNLSNPSWNGTGYFFYDTGYTLPLADGYTRLQFGKSTVGASLTGDGLVLERLGAEAITVSEAASSEAAASAYFADEPGDPLKAPVLTITGSVNPTSPGSADGSITASWPTIPGASRYEAGIAGGDVDDGFEVVKTNATSPYTWTGLRAGVHTVAVRAIP